MNSPIFGEFLFGIVLLLKWKNRKFGYALKHRPSPGGEGEEDEAKKRLT
jgi:hypothetical protein